MKPSSDVVVTQESRSSVTFTVRQLSGGVQFSAPSREEAIRLVRGFAAKNAVDLWYSEDGTDTLVDAYRRSEGQAR